MNGDWDFGDELDARGPASRGEMRRQAHIVNGGEGKGMTECLKCGGSGQTRWGKCFRCDGKGEISVRSAAASKARVTAAENAAQWRSDHGELIAWLQSV